MELLGRVTADFPDVPVIVITAHGTVDSAVEALKAGAFDYITKPFEQDELKKVIAKATRAHDLERQNVHAGPAAGERPPLVGASPAMRQVYDVIAKVADSPSTVLITGESGTGKELVARALHQRSSRRDKPLIKVNCAAIPKDLVESELFGYEKGAFTGAVELQAGPLRAGRRRHPLPRRDRRDPGRDAGEAPARAAGVGVRAGRRHQDHPRRRAAGRRHQPRPQGAHRRRATFREDLYYRLKVVPIALPPLRDRREDIPLLVEHFIAKYDRRLGKRVERLDEEALAVLLGYAWPGNIRELENLVERSVLFADGPVILGASLPEALRERPSSGTPLPATAALGALAAPDGAPMKEIVRQAQAELERELIARALEETGDNVTRAAKRAADQPQVTPGEDEGAGAAG